MGERGGGGLGLKSDVFFGLQVDGPVIGGVPIYVCVCVCVCVCGGGGWGQGGRRGLISGSLLFIFRHRSPFSEESLRCLVAADL